MKTIKKRIKLIALIFGALILFQSCKVYRYETATIDDALRFSKNIKVVSNTNEIYKFKSLQKGETGIYGITNKTSKTAKKLASQIVENNNPSLVKIHLSEENIKDIYLQNKSMSTVGNFFIVIGSLLAVLGSFFALSGGVGDINWEGVLD